LTQAREWHPDLVILDIMMPDMDGWTVCQRIREVSDVPVIFMTALGAEKDVVRGLQLGADDYIVKPFGAKELVARIQAVLRRHKPDAQHEHTYTNGKLFINLDTHQVSVDGQNVELTPIEFKLLACLAEQEGKVLAHRFLLNQVWGPDYEDDRQYLKLYIWYLRQKIEDDPNDPKLILTQRGAGYRLVRVSESASM
jgi:two-component system KDP operon response regulator KdpE